MNARYATANVGERTKFDGRPGVDTVEELAREHPALVVVARTGWVAKGLVYALVGALAMPIAFRASESSQTPGDEASQSGAVAKIAESSAGETALWLVAIGLMLYVLWRVVSVLMPARNTAKAWATRVGYAISAVVYTVLAWSALSFARHDHSAGKTEDSRVESFTRDVMEHSGGRWLVGLIGAVLIAVGGYFAHKGITASFRDDLRGTGVGPVSTRQIVRLGQVGWLGRAGMMGLIGFFLIRAAVQFNPDDAEGLDGSLRRLAATSWGTVMVVAIGVGLLIYGAFCVLSAPIERLHGAD